MNCARRKRISSTSCACVRSVVRNASTAIPQRSGTEKTAFGCGFANRSGRRISSAAATRPAMYASAFASSSWIRREPTFFFLLSTGLLSGRWRGAVRAAAKPRQRRGETRQRRLDRLLADRDVALALGELAQAEAARLGERRLDQERR